MYLSIDFKLPDNIQEQIKEETAKCVTEYLIKNPKELKDMVKDCVKGYLKSEINNILQSPDVRGFLREKIMEEIGMEQKAYDKNVQLKAENELLKQLIEDIQDLCNIQSANTLDRIKAKIDEVLNG